MSDLSARLVEAARQQIHQFDDDLEDWTPEARKATVAVLRELADTARVIGENAFSGTRLATLADRIEQDASAVPAVSEDQPKPRESVTYEQYAEAIRAAAKAQTTSHQRHGMAHQPKTIYVGDMVKAAFDAAGIKVASVDLTALSEVLADSEQVTR